MDWSSRNKDAVINEVRKISNLDGHIILMHSIYSSTADGVRRYIRWELGVKSASPTTETGNNEKIRSTKSDF